MNLFTIKDLENLSGIKAHTIRIWEQRYSLIKPHRTQTNIRYYSSDELKKVLNIALLNKYGFKISHIDRMSPAEIQQKILSLSHEEAQKERIVNELIQNMIDLDMDKFEHTLDTYIMNRGIEKTIHYLVFPFLERIGILWLTNHINPAQEHLVSNIIRQKLIVGIDRAISHVKTNKKVLLFLPETEHHELGLLFIHYLLKKRGITVLYVGASVPVKDLEYICNLTKPDYIYTHLTTVTANFSFEKFVNQVAARIPETPLIISGQLAKHYNKKISPTVFLKKNLKEVTDYIESI